MSVFFRAFGHLLPDATAWRLTAGKDLTRFFDGIAAPFTNARQFADEVYGEISPETTSKLAEWESQYGIYPNPGEAVRRRQLAAEWAATGGQSPAYIQGVLQTAGFNVYVHEWWGETGSPSYEPIDPRDHTDPPLLGTYQCTGAPGDPDDGQPQCIGYTEAGLPLSTQPQCDNLLANDPGYIVNLDLTRRAPPPVPADDTYWPYFLYFGAATFPNRAEVPISRRAEFERLLLKLCPAQQWLVPLVDYVELTGTFDDTFDSTFG